MSEFPSPLDGPRLGPGSTGPAPLAAVEAADGPGPAEDPLEAWLAEALEAEPDARAAMLANLEREDAGQARRARARLAALGELGMALDVAPRSVDPPARFGPLWRLERVGGGGMGEVYLARDERTGALAALKLVRPDHLWFATARARFGREIHATSELAHPGIVRVLEVGEERGVPWLAMEWIGGAPLDEVLEHLRGVPPEALGPRDLERAVSAAAALRPHPEPAREGAFPGASHIEVVARLVERVATALAHAHERGVLHRDVKPANILVTPAGRVLLSDFGLALPRGADRMTRTGSWLGSLPYAAPEQIEGSPRALDARADVYSLGATFYELLTLRTPFLGGPESAVRRRIATGDLEPPRRLNPQLGRDLERLCLAALDPDPGRRPRGASEMAAEIERALAGRAVRARAAPIWLRAKRWARRRPGLALALALAGLVVSGSLALAVREGALAARFARLGDAELVRGLEEEARGFWPASPQSLAAMAAWLGRAEELLERRADHGRALDELTRAARPYGAEDRARDRGPALENLATLAHEIEGLAAFVARGERSTQTAPPRPEDVRARDVEVRARLAAHPEGLIATLRERVSGLRTLMAREPVLWRPDSEQLDDFERLLARTELELSQRRTFRFEDALDSWRYEALRRLLQDLDRLAGWVPRVRAQRASTAALLERASGPGASAWAQASAAIEAAPRYGGLVLPALFGLEPLGENPASGLWEFLLLASGAAPARADDASGSWRVGEDSGVVLVLLPGGRFTMGQRPDERPPLASASPQHEIELAPFLIARHELTVAQAERLGGYPPERKRPADGCLPLVLEWQRARALLREHGLELPTEAQWEYAARAEASTPMPLAGAANVLDRSRIAALRGRQARQEGVPAEFDDGFPDTAPVGRLRPNAFGLHDTLGNVSEWCLDSFVGRGYSTLTARAGDGLRATIVPAQLRAVRGGSYVDGPDTCQPAARMNEVPSRIPLAIGVRPVLLLPGE